MTKVSDALAIAIQHHQARQLSAAGDIYKRILQADPRNPDALYLFGVLAHDLGNDETAVDFIRQSIQMKGPSAESAYNLAGAYSGLRRYQDAISSYRQAIQLKPDFSEALFNLGNELRRLGEFSEAIGCYHQALERKPHFVDAHINLGLALTSQGKHEKAIASYVQALTLKPDDAGAHSNLLMTLHCCTGMSLASLSESHAEFDRLHCATLTNADSRSKIRSRQSHRIRLGFVSADLGQHPVGYFAIRAFENIDQESFEVFCYSDRHGQDDLTQRFQSRAAQWRDVRCQSDEQLAEQIRTDEIDILFDLAGHTANNRLLAFARRPAPIQITWAGYMGTTGLNAMDYLLADRFHIPVEAEQHYRERVLRMPDGYVCYDPPAYAPSVSPLPALENNFVTFGCFNNPSKITVQAIQVWAAILNRIPRSRLIFKYKGWNDRTFARQVAEVFALHAVEHERLEFHGQSPHAELLVAYNRIDLALDTFPYSGGLTSCEAMWMGVPVIACPGETFASRHSLSHLSNAGLTETIAFDMEHYANLAVSMSEDLPRLANLRSGLRNQMANSPLCDGKRFSSNLTIILQNVWNQFRSLV